MVFWVEPFWINIKYFTILLPESLIADIVISKFYDTFLKVWNIIFRWFKCSGSKQAIHCFLANNSELNKNIALWRAGYYFVLLCLFFHSKYGRIKNIFLTFNLLKLWGLRVSNYVCASKTHCNYYSIGLLYRWRKTKGVILLSGTGPETAKTGNSSWLIIVVFRISHVTKT
jgi:hypothetical protein